MVYIQSATAEIRYETCCTRVAENTGRKKSPKIRHMGTIAQLCRAVSRQGRHIWTIGKNLLSSNISSRRPRNMANFGPLTAEIGSGVCSTPANFNGFSSCLCYCSDVAHRSPTNFVQCLAVSWAGTLCIHFRGLLPCDGMLSGAKFILRPTLAFCYICSAELHDC